MRNYYGPGTVLENLGHTSASGRLESSGGKQYYFLFLKVRKKEITIKKKLFPIMKFYVLNAMENSVVKNMRNGSGVEILNRIVKAGLTPVILSLP